MKNMKKIFALVLATMMLMSMMAAFAEDPTLGLDTSVSVTGLMEGDALKLYQVLTWDDASSSFKLAAGFTGLTEDTTNFPVDEDDKTSREQEVIADIIDGITQTQANAIAAYTKTIDEAKDTATIGDSASYTYTLEKGDDNKPLHSELGMYMAVITAGTPKYVYNPVFISADFVTNNTSTTIDASTADYGTSSVAKRQEITVDKTTADINEGRGETDSEEDKAKILATAINSYVGEEVDFKVETTIPVFLDSYKNPSFVIKDVISTGIELVTGSIKVKLGDAEPSSTYEATNYTVAETGTTGYTVTFDKDYLDANVTAVPVVITYKGKITNEAEFNINADNNTVTVTYSNGPDEEKAALRDRTNHYTFSLGANVFGKESEHGKTYELVKVGVDADGKPVVEEKQVSEWSTETKRHPLANATFGLYTDAGCTTLYTNDLYPDGATFTTGEDGIITFKGLAAGDYYLMETQAPSGYIKDSRKAHIKIEAHYKNVTVPATEEDGIQIAGYEVEVLDWYKVTVNNVSVYDSKDGLYEQSEDAVISTYTYDNKGPDIDKTKLTPAVNDSDLINTVGVELPSTGGMGTTLFYIGGGALILVAVIFLVTKRRMSGND